MIYVMGKTLYEEYTKLKKGKKAISHGELIQQINHTFGLRGEVTDIQVS